MLWNEADLAMQSARYSSDLSTSNRFVDAGFALVSAYCQLANGADASRSMRRNNQMPCFVSGSPWR
jgi:hypothetical protein